ncbi:helix-turn-helix transcriptional regulator [Pseudactinotalea suaedae]|uniref:helix-turn-helix transcriptional regulator n=1 Tax=Pseudactinotalea suaedae TaxID=1524924 RepID=UPI0012E274DF|nr:LuxR family transcriptional regulator [Pseudactinotalea suaedae]
MRSPDRTHHVAVPTRAHLPEPGSAVDQEQLSRTQGTPGTPGIRAALEAGKHVVVLGEAGIGKTHLVNAALRPGPPAGTRLVNLTPMVHGPGDQPGPGTLDHLLGAHTVRTDPDAAADALWRWASSGTEGTRVLLRLEKAHLVDEASLAVVRRVAERPEVTLVVTHRSDPSLPPLLGDLADVARFTVRPLDTAGVETLLVELLGGFPTADTVHRLWVATRGNPFYLCELVRDQRARGALSADDGIWVWTGAPALSLRLLDSTLHDLAHLSTDERHVVELAAIAGPIPADAMTSAVRDRLLRLGMLRPTRAPADRVPAARFEVVHPLQADAICAQIGTRRRRELLSQARAWEDRAEAATDELVRSVIQSVGAQVEVALPELLRACGHAVRADDPHAAVELTSAALRTTTADLDSVAILTARADAHLHIGDIDAALRDLGEVRRTLEALDADGRGVLDAYLRSVRLEAMVRHFLSTDLASTLAMLDRSAAWLRPHASTLEAAARALQTVEALRLAHVAWGGRHPEMLEVALETLRRAEHAEDVVPLVAPTVFALSLAGRPAEAEQLSRRYLPVIAEHPALHRWEPGTFTLTRFFTLVLSGEIQAAEQTSPLTGGMVDMVSRHQRRGVVAAARGDWTIARHELRAANARLRLRDSLGVLPYTLGVEAMVAAAAGEAVSARALLAELRSTPRRCSLVTGAHLDMHVVDALIWLGDPAAVTLATRLARAAARDGQCAIELEALHRIAVAAGTAAARRAVPTGSLEERVTWLADRTDGRRHAVLVDHLRAMLGRRAHAVEEAAAMLQEVGIGLPATVAPTRLTRREREIATLAAGGMTSKAIAQRLVLSVRTVDSHLAGAYAKLGVHSREGLQEALAETSG